MGNMTIQAKNLAVSDLLVAVLRDADGPLSTKKVAALAGFYPDSQKEWGQYEAYALLRRLERHDVVTCFRIEGDLQIYWSLSPTSQTVSLDDMPPLVLTSDVALS